MQCGPGDAVTNGVRQLVVVRGMVGMARPGLILYYSARFFGQVAQNLLFAALFVAAGTSDNAAIGLSSLLIATTAASLLFGVMGGAPAGAWPLAPSCVRPSSSCVASDSMRPPSRPA